MARRQVVLLQCDRCNAECTEEDVYTVLFADGSKEFILCEKHNSTFARLRDTDYGSWIKKRTSRGRNTFKKVNLEDIQ